jgi:hypothetical protein
MNFKSKIKYKNMDKEYRQKDKNEKRLTKKQATIHSGINNC